MGGWVETLFLIFLGDLLFSPPLARTLQAVYYSRQAGGLVPQRGRRERGTGWENTTSESFFFLFFLLRRIGENPIWRLTSFSSLGKEKKKKKKKKKKGHVSTSESEHKKNTVSLSHTHTHILRPAETQPSFIFLSLLHHSAHTSTSSSSPPSGSPCHAMMACHGRSRTRHLVSHRLDTLAPTAHCRLWFFWGQIGEKQGNLLSREKGRRRRLWKFGT